jgi:diguanylate cyclase (GGDEF)-like protein
VLLFIDLDGFKDINDRYGHEVGDEVLITVGSRLLKGIRRTDFVARLGGDEFAIIIHDIIDIADVENLAHKIHEMLQEIMHIDTIQCIINSSIGIAIDPDTGTTSETLLRHADRAMYEIKRNGKARIGFFKNS